MNCTTCCCSQVSDKGRGVSIVVVLAYLMLHCFIAFSDEVDSTEELWQHPISVRYLAYASCHERKQAPEKAEKEVGRWIGTCRVSTS